MKNKRIISFALCAGMIFSFMPKSLAAQNVNMAIDEEKVIRTVDREMYGINCEWDAGMNNDFLAYDGKTLKTDPGFTEAWQDIFVFGRQAGNSSQKIFWKKAIGPLADRESQLIWWVNDKVYMGIIEWLQAVYSVTPDAKVTYVVNFDNDTLENLADVVEFLVGDGSVNYNGGENWAEVRKSLGIENPVDIFTWELGNELDWSLAWSIDEYIDYCKKVIPIIRSIDPDGKITCHANTAAHANGDGWEEWHRRVLREFGDEIDYLSFHYYYPASYVRRADVPLDRIEADILEITGSDRIKLYMSEQAPAPNSYEYNKAVPYDYCLPHTIWGATAHAEFYLRSFLRPSLVASNCHSVNSSAWCIVYFDENGVHRPSAVGETIKTFVKYGVGEVLESDLDTYSKNESSSIAGGVIRDKDGNINIIFTNRFDTEPVTVDFKFKNGSYRVKKVRKIHGNVKSADLWYREGSQWEYHNPDKVYTTEEEIEASGVLSSYTFEPLSLYALQLEKTNGAGIEQPAEAQASKYIGIGGGMKNAYVFGKNIPMDDDMQKAAVLTDNGRLFVSSQMVKLLFGASIKYDEGENLCIVALNDRTLVFNTAEGTVSENTEAVNDIDSAVKIDGEIYFPLRSLAENLGDTVTWDGRGFAVISPNGTALADRAVCDAIYAEMTGGERLEK